MGWGGDGLGKFSSTQETTLSETNGGTGTPHSSFGSSSNSGVTRSKFCLKLELADGDSGSAITLEFGGGFSRVIYSNPQRCTILSLQRPAPPLPGHNTIPPEAPEVSEGRRRSLCGKSIPTWWRKQSVLHAEYAISFPTETRLQGAKHFTMIFAPVWQNSSFASNFSPREQHKHSHTWHQNRRHTRNFDRPSRRGWKTQTDASKLVEAPNRISWVVSAVVWWEEKLIFSG